MSARTTHEILHAAVEELDAAHSEAFKAYTSSGSGVTYLTILSAIAKTTNGLAELVAARNTIESSRDDAKGIPETGAGFAPRRMSPVRSPRAKRGGK